VKVSLVVPTVDRVRETERLFESVAGQDFRELEVILVDQSPGNRYGPLVGRYAQQFPILHLREPRHGVSRARNVAFGYVQGDVVAFPDDDCVYPEGLLTRVAHFFDSHPEWDGLLTRVFDLDADENAFEHCGDENSQEVGYAKGYKVCASPGMFLRGGIAGNVAFNEHLGAGAGTPWGAGEETDYLFRCLDAGYRFYYDANVVVRHPNPLKVQSLGSRLRRGFGYGRGNGYFLATHVLPPEFLRAEREAPYRDAIAEMRSGDAQRACYFLLHGIGTTIGYRAGRKVCTH